MKKINKSIFAFAFLLIFTACEKDRAFLEFKDLQYGAFARLLDGVNGAFDFFNIDGSTVDFTVEFYDEAQGKNVQSYSWTVAYVADGTVGAAANLATFNASEFKPEPTSGYPSIQISFTFRQALDALGLTKDDIKGGDALEFQATITKTDGTTFTAANTQDNLEGQPAYKAHFFFRQAIVCPSDLGGTYSAFTTYHQHDFIAAGYTENTQDVEFVDKGNGIYDVVGFDGGLYGSGPYVDNYGTSALTVTITDACGNITFDGATDPWQNLVQDPARPTTFDPATGVITISALGDVYGENWTTVYTPK